MMHFLKVLPCRFLMFKLMIVLIVSAVSYSAGASLSCQFILRDYLLFYAPATLRRTLWAVHMSQNVANCISNCFNGS